MKKLLLLLLSVCYTLGSVAQESYPLQAIERTSFYAEPVDPPTETALPSGNIAARDGGGNTVGLTTGELSVSGTGAAVYTVPIVVPKGIGGVAPTLALTYNSQSGNGIAGYGWHLAGLSVISRVGSTMYHNDKITEVNLTETDQFALDGQRLMLKEGKHGESGAVYETETFSQVRIKAVGKSKNAAFGPDYFEVLYPDGSKAYYGKENNSQSPMEYAISSWENAQGVRIEYTYTYAEKDNQQLISNITYGGKGAQPHKVIFKYNDRNRIEEAYAGGVKFVNRKILSQIEIYNNNQYDRTYYLKYDKNDLNYNRLRGISEVRGMEAKAPIEFRYSNTNKGLKVKTSGVNVPSDNINIYNTETVSLDINGDSNTDFLLYHIAGKDSYRQLYFFDNFNKTSLYNNNIGYITPYSFSETRFEDVFPSKIVLEQGQSDYKQAFVIVQQFGDSISFKTYTRNSTSLYNQDEKRWKLPVHFEEGQKRCEYIWMHWMMDDFVDPNEPVKEISRCENIKFISGDFDGNGLTDVLAIEKPVWKDRCTMILPKKENGDYDYYESIKCIDCENYRDYRGNIYWIDLDKRKRKDYVKNTHNGVSLDKDYALFGFLRADY